MVDDAGAELLLVTFAINNTNQVELPGHQGGGTIYVKDTSRAVEARVWSRWTAVRAASGRSTTSNLQPGAQSQRTVLVPVGADVCRVWLQYTDLVSHYPLTLRGMSGSIAERLPLSIRSQLSGGFWRWVGFPERGPGPKWRDLSVELSVPQSATGANSGEMHNRP
jgi:hypothetical protein